MFETVMLAVLYECETWCVILKEDWIEGLDCDLSYNNA